MSQMNELIAQFQYTLAKFEEIAARMEEREEALDATMRDFPFPDGVIPPPLPEEKTKWIYRGTFKGGMSRHPGRHIMVMYEGGWHSTTLFSGDLHHIEAV